MSTATQWILIDPLDTLFFKGSEPMVAGENHEVRSVFPPVPSTLRGAICSAILRQRGIDPAEFVKAPKGLSSLPLLGTAEKLGIEVIGPLLHLTLKDGGEDWFFSAPANWFAKVPDNLDEGPREIEVSVADVREGGYSHLGITGSNPFPAMVMDPKDQDMKSLSGFWTNATALDAIARGKPSIRVHGTIERMRVAEPIIAPLSAFYCFESRIGIALEDHTRRVKRGHLYSTTHARLESGVRLGLGMKSSLIPSHLNRQGTLQLGGEQRVCRYEQLPQGPSFTTGRTAWVMSLSVLPFRELKDLENLPRVSGAIIRMGGWDMQKHFHKPMRAYLPQGTVIRIGEETSIPEGFIRI